MSRAQTVKHLLRPHTERIHLCRAAADRTGLPWRHSHRAGPVEQHPAGSRGGGFGKTAFAIDWQARQAVCPTGATSRHWTQGVDNNGRDALRIRFATAICAPCPVRDQCTRSTQYGRQLTVHAQVPRNLCGRLPGLQHDPHRTLTKRRVIRPSLPTHDPQLPLQPRLHTTRGRSFLQYQGEEGLAEAAEPAPAGV